VRRAERQFDRYMRRERSLFWRALRWLKARFERKPIVDDDIPF
jgi:hypothetical protein